MTSGTSYSPPPAFGRFKLLHQIGAGVLGPVFRAHDPQSERLVAVKALTLDITPEQASALSAEFQRLVALELDDACVAAPVGAGVEESVPYIAAPFVAGESLDAAIRQYGPAPAGDAIRLVAHVAEALDAAAQVGVFHGSLHPRDIIVTPGETHVAGLGIAQALERVGLHGPVRRPYVAPEREGGDEWGAAADIYSLAAIAYEVLTGRRALPGTDQPLPALNEIRVHDGEALREAIESGLEADPERRPARARDFAAAFAAALSDSAAPSERAPEKRVKKPRARPPKLPGLDEPLLSQDGAVKGRARTGGAAAVPGAAAEPPTAQGTAEPAGSAGDVRYVPVTDPADAGDSAREAAVPELSLPVVPLEREPQPVEAADAPAGIDRLGAVIAAGPTPDLRLAVDLLPRAEAAGETVDAELAAALDRMAADHGAGPTPTNIGIDIFGPTPTARVNADEPAKPDVTAPPVAEAPDPLQLAAGSDVVTLQAPPQEKTEAEAPGESVASDAASVEDLSVAAGGRAEDSVEPTAAESSLPSDEERPFVRGRGGERRRTPFRPIRSISPEPAAREAGDAGSEVPRALDQARPTPPSRPVPDFELLARPEPGRSSGLPVVIGVAAGLILGMAAGYWLGVRSSTPPAGVSQAPVSQVPGPRTAPQTTAAVSVGAAPTAPAVDVAARTAEPPAAAAEPKPSAPEPAAPPPAATAAAPAAPSTSGAAHGTIAIVAAPQQANVYLDGARIGLTPRNLNNVPLGSHTVRVTRPGYVALEQTVVLTAEEPAARLEFALRPESAPRAAGAAAAPAVKSVLTVLVESTPPGAHIRIDGRDLAVTPLTVRQMRPGMHKIEVRLDGYRPWSTSITVAAGDNRRVTAALERINPR